MFNEKSQIIVYWIVNNDTVNFLIRIQEEKPNYFQHEEDVFFTRCKVRSKLYKVLNEVAYVLT